MDKATPPKSIDTQQLPKIDATAKTIQGCFTQCIYSVPQFQRPYSWESPQLEDYWNDVVLAKGDLFFGTIVTWISKERELFPNEYSLIDGQQRLTTSAIALSVVRDWLEKLASSGLEEETQTKAEQRARSQAKTLAKSTQKYLVMLDDDGESHAIIERPEPAFWENVQQPDAIPSGARWGESAVRIGESRRFFENRVAASLEPSAGIEQKVTTLRDIRNNILKARLIQVELEKEEDAFLIFETLNTRGSDLQLKDLIKNDLVRGVSVDRRDREAVSERWQRIIDRVVVEGSPSEAGDSFIWQSWNSRRPAVKQGELYKALKANFASAALTRLTYLAELEVDSLTYQYLDAGNRQFPVEKRGVRNAVSVPEVQDAFCALSVFNVTVANSALMALVRKYDSTKVLSRKNLIRAVTAIEKFHFQNTQLASTGSTGGTRSRYNRFAVGLASARTANEVTARINDLVSKLQRSLPPKDVVKARFRRIFYSPGLPLTNAERKSGDQELVRYVLLTIAKFEGAVPFSRRSEGWTIEHILPGKNGHDHTSDPVYNIGNLTLLSGRANSKVADGRFVDKRTDLSRLSLIHDDTLVSWLADMTLLDIGSAEISSRAHALADLAIDEVWRV